MNILFTIGHSIRTRNSFLEALENNNITAIADVRTNPYSQYKPEFNQDELRISLKAKNIAYSFLGKECGARRVESECYTNGKVDFVKVAKHPTFQEGIKRIHNGVTKFTIALMCSEEDPITCHRMLLICRNLPDLEIKHVIKNNDVEEHAATEKRMAEKLFSLDGSKDTEDIFSETKTEEIKMEDMIKEAYKRQADKIAYDKNKINAKKRIEKVKDNQDNKEIKMELSEQNQDTNINAGIGQ